MSKKFTRNYLMINIGEAFSTYRFLDNFGEEVMHAEEYLALVRECRDEEKMFQFLKEDKPGVALELAKSKNVTPRILDILTRHVSITVRHEVAKNPLTSVDTLKRLSSDKDMLVRDYARRTLKAVEAHL